MVVYARDVVTGRMRVRREGRRIIEDGGGVYIRCRILIFPLDKARARFGDLLYRLADSARSKPGYCPRFPGRQV